MNATTILELGQSGLEMTMLLGAPLLLASLAVGLLVSLFQVATSLQDVTLTFVPKLLALGVALLLLGAWMMRTLVEFTRELFLSMGGALG